MARASGLPVGREIVVLRLHPSVAHAWLGVPMVELLDRAVPLSAIAPRKWRALDEARRLGSLTTLVRPDAARRFVDRRFYAAAEQLGLGATVGQAAATIAVSPRQIGRLFAGHAGHSPKSYARIVRLRNAMRAACQGASLASVALGHGYADQAHFCRDVRGLTGRSPRALLGRVGSVQDAIVGALSPRCMTISDHDTKALRTILATVEQAWDRGDGRAFASVFTEDADFINIMAHALRGREAIAARFDAPRLSCIHRDVVLIESFTTMRGPDGTERRAHMFCVAVRQGDGWALRAVHNMLPFTPPTV